MRYYHTEEILSKEERYALQSERLKATVERVYSNVPFYREKMKALGIEPGDIKGVDDLHLLPYTTKQDLRDNYPYGLFATPMEDVVRIHASSGTTGQPTVVGYTKKDIQTWASIVARCLNAYGVTKKDIVQVAYGYGLFTGGLGVHYGVEDLGATVVPMSGGNTKKQIQLIQEFKTSVLTCTPSYALYLGESILKADIDPSSLDLRIGIFGAEPWTEEMRTQLEELLGIKAVNIYGLSEIMGPGVAFECDARNGLHINDDHFIPEVVDTETLNPLAIGEQGELVFSCITKEALPLLRYRTRDLTALHEGTCDCGRTLTRMDRISARSDDMLIIRGVNVFPSQIESVICKYKELAPHYMINVDRVSNLDTISVDVEASLAEMLILTPEITARVEKSVSKELHSRLGLHVPIKIVMPNTIERSEGKAKRVLDKRHK